jgi:hypothetical protein
MWKFGGWILIFLSLVGCDPACKSIPNVEQPVAPDIEQPAVSEKTEDTNTISILAWNVESGGNDPKVIAQQLTELGGYDIYCLSEVADKNFVRYLSAVGSGFTSFNGNTGRNDRLQISFDTERFELLESKELMKHRDFVLNNGTHRSPLYVRLQDRNTGIQFIVMTNHLARGNADLRKQQAIGLREWARDQNVGVINIGDFNMDYDFRTERGNDAFPEIIRDNIFSWVKPVELIDTNWLYFDLRRRRSAKPMDVTSKIVELGSGTAVKATKSLAPRKTASLPVYKSNSSEPLSRSDNPDTVIFSLSAPMKSVPINRDRGIKNATSAPLPNGVSVRSSSGTVVSSFITMLFEPSLLKSHTVKGDEKAVSVSSNTLITRFVIVI